MQFNKLLFTAIQARLKAETALELRVTPAESLPFLILDSIRLDADNDTQDQKYTLNGQISVTYMAEFTDNQSYLSTFDKAQSIITALHGQQDVLKTLQPALELTRIDFDSFSQELLTEEKGDKNYSSIDINFNFSIF